MRHFNSDEKELLLKNLHESKARTRRGEPSESELLLIEKILIPDEIDCEIVTSPTMWKSASDVRYVDTHRLPNASPADELRVWSFFLQDMMVQTYLRSIVRPKIYFFVLADRLDDTFSSTRYAWESK